MLSFVTPIAYDYAYAFGAIRSYYDIADEIILGLDQERISWSGRRYPFDEEGFRAGIEALDQARKIKIIEGHFHGHPHPLANDCQERLVLINHCKPGNWAIQIDSDEYLLNAAEFAAWMRGVPSHVGVRARWVCVFKRFADDYLLIREPNSFICVGSVRRDRFIAGREAADQFYINSPLVLLHHAYGRTRAEVELKVRNWSHSAEINLDAFLALWDGITLDNFHTVRDFHPLHAPWWHSLERVTVTDQQHGG